MRKSEEIKADLAAANNLPELERVAVRDRLFLEVLLDIRERLDSVDSWVCHLEGHAEEIRRVQRLDFDTTS